MKTSIKTMLVSGLLLAFKMATAEELKLPSVQPLSALVERDGKFYQPVTISLDYQGEPADAARCFLGELPHLPASAA